MGNGKLYSPAANNNNNLVTSSPANAVMMSSSSINLAGVSTSGNNDQLLNAPKLLHSSHSCHEFYLKHNHNNVHSSLQSSFHFHLAGLIDPEAGIPLQPSLSQTKGANFVVHWVDNKDFHFTYAAELFSREIYERIREKLKAEKLKQQQKDNSDFESDDDLNGDKTPNHNSDDISLLAGKYFFYFFFFPILILTKI